MKENTEISKLMNQLDFSNIDASFNKLEVLDISLKWNIPPIQKLKNQNIHYRCPECHNFPLIQFLNNQESLYYTCACHEKKFLNIEELFIKENKYMTFLESSQNEKKEENIGFKCTKHKSIKYNKFKYFCIICKENLCKECCQNHLKNCHDLIVLDFQNFEIYEKIDEIIKVIHSDETKKSESSDIDVDNFMEDDEKNEKIKNDKKTEKFKLVNIGNNICHKISFTKLEKIHEDFIELVKIIINDYINYPNYYHFFNIENIYRIIISENNQYLIKDSGPKKNESKYKPRKAKLEFLYYGKVIIIECLVTEKMKDIYDRLLSKLNQDIRHLNFMYNGEEINENIRIEQIVNEADKDQDKNIYIMRIEVINTNQENLKFENIICPKCGENTLIQLKDYKINCYDCKKMHKINNLLFKEFEKTQNIDLSKIECENCYCFNKAQCGEKFYKCLTCDKNLCDHCIKQHENNHMIIIYDKLNYLCHKHKNPYLKYCNECKINLCKECEKEHINHNNIDFNDIIQNKDNLLKKIDYFSKNIDNLDSNVQKIVEKIYNVIDILHKYNVMSKKIVTKFISENCNYYTFKNINEIINYINIINDDISKIIDEKNLSKKLSYIMKIYCKMNNISDKDYTIDDKILFDKSINKTYNDKITYLFSKEPQNIQYKLDIINTNDFYGVNDLFEIFISYKDNKEYIVSKNINDYNLDIFTLLNNEKISSLKGHKNRVTTIRYFINNKDCNEYLISADIEGIVIVWEINNIYGIKCKINTGYSLIPKKGIFIYSSLLLFPKIIDTNYNYNYIVISTNYVSNKIDNSASKIYLLNNGKYFKYIKETNKEKIFYLLSWYNKNNDNYYIIELAEGKILINNILSDELYAELKQEPESIHDSGFIYSKHNNDYLCCSSTDGFINIWDLYNKSIFKRINTYKSWLMHIIEWNNKYIIATDLNNNLIKIIDLYKNEVIKAIPTKHIDGIKSIKKIYHPNYGECLLSAGRDKTIKLWNINI